MNECRCKLLMRIEDSWIPDYSVEITTAGPMGQPAINVPQYECCYCGRRWGYVKDGTRVIKSSALLKHLSD